MEVEAVQAEPFKAAMASFAAGVTIITTVDARGALHALTATAFSSVSLEPPLCLVCIDKRARTYRSLLVRGCFAVNILNAGQESLSVQFASSVVDKFAGVRWWPGQVTSCPIIEGALAWMECRVVEVHSGGDHDIVLGRVVAVQVQAGSPLVYWRGSYSSLPPPPESDPTDDRSAPGPASARAGVVAVETPRGAF
jgi:flavin reductase (DIM6/NTAB) family NADH-FMN oxidoreductase RutF